MKATIFNRTIIGRLSFLFIGLSIIYFGSTMTAKAVPVAVNFQVFYDELIPYGDWIEDPNYGYIWIPFVDQNFQPYRTNGHWVMSSYGNTWVSNYDWGWAPFHYGRWFFSDLYGWAWIPGYEWGPAWVNWRSGSGYYGWLPMAPRVQFYASLGYPAYSHWMFVPRRRLLSRNLFRYYAPYRNVNVIYNQTTIINNTYVHNNQTYVAGPSRSELQRVTRRKVPVYQVSNGTRPGRTAIKNNQVELYRPDIRQTASQGRRLASARPSKVISSGEYTRSRSNATIKNQRSGNMDATSPRNNNRSVRSEALSNSGRNNTRSANTGFPTRQSQINNSRGQASPWVNRSVESGQRRTDVRSQNERRGNQAVTRQREAQRSTMRRNTPNQRQVGTPSHRQVSPGNERRVRSSAPVQRQIRPTAPSQRQQVRRAAPGNHSNNFRSQPSRQMNSSPRVNNSSRTQSRYAAPQRSPRTSSNSRRAN